VNLPGTASSEATIAIGSCWRRAETPDGDSRKPTAAAPSDASLTAHSAPAWPREFGVRGT